MAYEAGVATDQQDFIDKLRTFATSNGWTLGGFDATNKRASVSRDNVFVSWRWDSVSGTGGIAGYQSLGFVSQALSATVANGGTGYSVSDQLTLVGGTFTTAAVFNVDSVSGGVVTAVSLVTAGAYTVVPGNPVSTSGGTGTGCTLTVTFHLAAPETHTDDSGNGLAGTAAVTTERKFNSIGNGPFVSHFFFADASISPYVHYVLEYKPGEYRHGSFGSIEKFGTWTGGEYHAMTHWDTSFGSADSLHSILLDGRNETQLNSATIHCENLTGQTAGGKWGVFMNASNTGNDRQDTPVAREWWSGGFREGFINAAIAGIRANPSNGFVPMAPILVYYRTGGSGQNWRFQGKMIHAREMNGFFFQPQQEVTIGSDTWKLFPMSRKASTGTPHSGNMFVAYRKIV